MINFYFHKTLYNISVQFTCSVMSDSLQSHGLQHTRLPCPSPTPRVYSNSCQLSRWCHPTISSSVVPFSSCPQSFPGSGSFLFLNFYFYFILLYNTVLVLPYIDMNPPRVYMSSQTWTPLSPTTPYHLSGSSPCTSPKHPISCIEHRLAIHFLHDSIHVSMPFSQIIPPSPSPSESKSLLYTSVSLLLSCIQGHHCHLSKFHIYVLVYCIGVSLSGLLHSV